VVRVKGKDAAGTVFDTALQGGMTNPMTTRGDIIYSADNSGTPARLQGNGTSDTFCLVSIGSGGLQPPYWFKLCHGTLNAVPNLVYGTSGSKPAAGSSGRWYLCADTFTLYYDDGSAWTAVGVPPGTLAPYAGATVPSGYLECDGSAVSRTTYADLFTAIGTTWGSGNGSTTFNLPDLRDRTVLGTSPGGLSGNRPTARSLGQTGGEEAHQLTSAELPATGVDPAGGSYFLTDDRSSGRALAAGSDQPYGVGAGNVTGGNSAHNTMMPFACVRWLVKT
jgi:microcystin-dependent protein